MSSQTRIQAQYHIVFFEATEQFVGMAWDYDHAFIVATEPQTHYGKAHAKLLEAVTARNADLRWFDGEFRVCKGSSQMIPAL